jgi:hypothetical protein
MDLVTNAVYWLADRENLIAAGPAEFPRVEPISDGKRTTLQLTVVGWACVVLIAGGAMWMVRRK